ncbi:MAG: DUF2235 domain-containing protein [Saprospiraceae bacterium]|nr:DUF2235 domain-containing protein [Saprospiraceae bacterium]
MKNIIICCDGTSNDFGDRNSNVVKLFSVLAKDQIRQIVYYDPGVGTPSTYDAFNPVTKKLMYAFGQGFGYGLSDNIMDAYRFLMQCYKEGDRVYLFGFSRGAYTVRAVAGLLHTCGLLYDHNENLVSEAMRIYHDRGTKIADRFKKTFCRPCPVYFLGLWDTVTSVGRLYNPLLLQATTNNPDVKIIRHAIAIDERRAFFRQNLWGNKHEEMQDIKQVWFAGSHSDVGGSYPLDRSGLSNISLEWMIAEAMDKGILIDDLAEARQVVGHISNPELQDINEELKGGWYIAEIWPKLVWVKRLQKGGKSQWKSKPYLNLGRPRFITSDATLHESVLLRLQQRPDYRPKNLLRKIEVAEVAKRHPVEPWKRL